jgi:hypothetical protein
MEATRGKVAGVCIWDLSVANMSCRCRVPQGGTNEGGGANASDRAQHGARGVQHSRPLPARIRSKLGRKCQARGGSCAAVANGRAAAGTAQHAAGAGEGTHRRSSCLHASLQRTKV